MKQALISVKLVLMVVLFASAESFDESQPYGRIAWFAGNGQEQRTLGTKAAPVVGEKITGQVDASTPCDLLLVPLTKKGRHAIPTMRPVMVSLEGWSECQLPPRGTEWVLPGDEVEIRAIFLPKDHSNTAHLQKLTTEMGKAELPLFKAQGTKLRELLGKLDSSAPTSTSQPIAAAVVGGTFRGAPTNWRDFAKRVNFRSENPGVLVFSSNPESGSENGAPR